MEELIAELIEEHRAIEAQAGQLLRIVAGEAADPAAVAAIRWRMAQELFDHCAREGHAVYDVMIASGDAAATRLAWRYRQDHGALAAQFGNYVAEWPLARMRREWAGFREATRTMMVALAARVAVEEANLYPEAQRVLGRRAA